MAREETPPNKSIEGRTLPDLLTGPGMQYIGRIIEIRQFVFAFFEMTTLVRKLSEQNPNDSSLSKYKFEKSSDLAWHPDRQLINEICLARSVESFELYIINILWEIFQICPDMLKSEAPITAALALESKTIEDIIYYLLERKLHELSYKPLSDLRKFIESRTGVDLFASINIFSKVLAAIEIRNLIAHNDCIPNRIFRGKVRNVNHNLLLIDGQKLVITREWLLDVTSEIDGAVFDFDAAVAEKFGIRRSNPKATLIDRFSASSVTFARARRPQSV